MQRTEGSSSLERMASPAGARVPVDEVVKSRWSAKKKNGRRRREERVGLALRAKR